MHNLVSQNRLIEWQHSSNYTTQASADDLMDDYFECLIDCSDSSHDASCRRICSEMLR